MKKSNRKEYASCNDTFREFAYAAESYGYCCIRRKGSHFVFRSESGSEKVANSKLNQMVCNRLLKEIRSEVALY